MYAHRFQLVLAAAALAFAGSSAAQYAERPIAVNVDGLAPHVAKRILEKARLGPTQLRLYLQRTRMIHGIHWTDVVRDD